LQLLVTRPEPDAEATAAALRARGHAVLVAPLTRIEPVAAELGPGPWAAVLISSANAARAMENHPQRQEVIGLPAIAVGDRSAAAARDAGFAEVLSAGGTAGDLVALAARHRWKRAPLLYLAGADRAADLVAELAARSVSVEMRVVYQAVAEGYLGDEVVGALRAGTLDGVLHYSRRSAEIYLHATAEIAAAALAPVHFCLSARVAESLAAAGAAAVRIAPDPDEESLLRLIGPA
jgi:uroporphyrinogen-III synthase